MEIRLFTVLLISVVVEYVERLSRRFQSDVEFTINSGEFARALEVRFATSEAARFHSCDCVGETPKS